MKNWVAYEKKRVKYLLGSCKCTFQKGFRQNLIVLYSLLTALVFLNNFLLPENVQIKSWFYPRRLLYGLHAFNLSLLTMRQVHRKRFNLSRVFLENYHTYQSKATEGATQRCSWEKVFWKYAANLQENTHAEVQFQ